MANLVSSMRGGYDPYLVMLQNQGWKPYRMANGELGWMPPVNPEEGVPWNLQLNQIQQSMQTAKTADQQKYINNKVRPDIEAARANMLKMGNRGSFGQGILNSMETQGNEDAANFGEEAASRSFGNLVNLRQQYLGAQDRANNNQEQLYSRLGAGPTSRVPDSNGGGSDGGYSSGGLGAMTKGKALMGALQGVTNFAAQNPYIQQGYKSGGLFGAAKAVPRAAGKILFGI